jgi:hypothetical protein
MNKYMIKPLLYWVAFLAILLCMCFVSCGKKPMPGTDKVITDVIKTSRDSSNVIDRNLAVIDSLKAYIGAIRTARPECDSVCQATVDRLLSQLNTQKTSGNNSYGFYYDEYKKVLTAYTKLGETINQKTNVAKASDRQTTVKITTTIQVAYTPAYMKYSAWFGWAAAAFFIIRIYLKCTTWFPKIFTT